MAPGIYYYRDASNDVKDDLTAIGCSENVEKTIKNYSKLYGVRDWNIYEISSDENLVEVELLLHKMLEKYHVKANLFKIKFHHVDLVIASIAIIYKIKNSEDISKFDIVVKE